MEKWTGRVALVTGASAGIGAEIARALVKAGMKVVGAARREERVKAMAATLESEKGSLLAVRCDLSKDEDIYTMFQTIKDTYGGVDLCVNNAGMTFNKSLLDGSPSEWRHMVDVNVIALCLCTKLSIASMRERGVDDGHIVTISSDSAYKVGPEGQYNFYAATKHAVRAIMEGLRQELREAKSHIRSSSISPGFVQTEAFQAMGMDEEKIKELFSSIKALQPEDLAQILLHIISLPAHVEINDVYVRPTEQEF